MPTTKEFPYAIIVVDEVQDIGRRLQYCWLQGPDPDEFTELKAEGNVGHFNAYRTPEGAFAAINKHTRGGESFRDSIYGVIRIDLTFDVKEIYEKIVTDEKISVRSR